MRQLIAEAWDAGGLYQVGKFPHGGVWSEWNGQVCSIFLCFFASQQKATRESLEQ